jgi:hypothetical protein
MPILNRFSGEISKTRSWSAFHYLWAGLLAGELNRVLPDGFIAESTIYTGSIEVDVRVDEWLEQAKSLSVVYQVPAPSSVIYTDRLEASEVQIFDLHNARKTVGVIEIVSPANKDRPQHREAFLAKCYSFIAYGISTAVVDLVTTRSFNFHKALMEKIQTNAAVSAKDADTMLYCSSYHYKADRTDAIVEVWYYPLQVGDVLPTLPLFISPEIAVPVKLEDAYMRTCQELRVG